MSKPEPFSVVVSPNHNGLVLIVLFSGALSRKRVVLRTHLTYDPLDGWPPMHRLLADALERVSEALQHK